MKSACHHYTVVIYKVNTNTKVYGKINSCRKVFEVDGRLQLSFLFFEHFSGRDNDVDVIYENIGVEEFP